MQNQYDYSTFCKYIYSYISFKYISQIYKSISDAFTEHTNICKEYSCSIWSLSNHYIILILYPGRSIMCHQSVTFRRKTKEKRRYLRSNARGELFLTFKENLYIYYCAYKDVRANGIPLRVREAGEREKHELRT